MNVKDCLYSDYITYNEWENGVTIQGVKMPVEMLSKEFRIKDSVLCEDLLNYMRINRMQNYNGVDREIILVTQPKSVNFEMRVIESILIIMKELLGRVSQSTPSKSN